MCALSHSNACYARLSAVYLSTYYYMVSVLRRLVLLVRVLSQLLSFFGLVTVKVAVWRFPFRFRIIRFGVVAECLFSPAPYASVVCVCVERGMRKDGLPLWSTTAPHRFASFHIIFFFSYVSFGWRTHKLSSECRHMSFDTFCTLSALCLVKWVTDG